MLLLKHWQLLNSLASLSSSSSISPGFSISKACLPSPCLLLCPAPFWKLCPFCCHCHTHPSQFLVNLQHCPKKWVVALLLSISMLSLSLPVNIILPAKERTWEACMWLQFKWPISTIIQDYKVTHIQFAGPCCFPDNVFPCNYLYNFLQY